MVGHDINTKEDALSLLRIVLYAAQKSRSIGFESNAYVGHEAKDTEDFLATLQPWLYGKNSVVPKLAAAIVRYEQPGVPIPGAEVFNWLYIAIKAEPSIGVCMVTQSDRWGSIEPDYRWMGQTFTDTPLYADEGESDPQGSPL